MNWKTHIKLTLLNLSSGRYANTCMKHYSNTETFKIIYDTYFHSGVIYGAIWGNSMDIKKFFYYIRKL